MQNSDTRDNPHLEVIKQVLKDVYEVGKELADISELVSTTEDETVSSKIADKTSAATEKLDRVHNYLMESFHNPAEFVLYRAQVSLFFGAVDDIYKNNHGRSNLESNFFLTKTS